MKYFLANCICFIHEYNYIHYTGGNDLIFGVLTPLSTICQLYQSESVEVFLSVVYVCIHVGDPVVKRGGLGSHLPV
jgi:hypothetical protein